MQNNKREFKDTMREMLAPEKVIRNREVNHGEVEVKQKGKNKVISYHTDDGKSYKLEYINDNLEKIYINNNLKFEY